MDRGGTKAYGKESTKFKGSIFLHEIGKMYENCSQNAFHVILAKSGKIREKYFKSFAFFPRPGYSKHHRKQLIFFSWLPDVIPPPLQQYIQRKHTLTSTAGTSLISCRSTSRGRSFSL